MRLAVVGASGRMGQELIRIIAKTEGVELAAALVREGASSLGKDASACAGIDPLGVTITADPVSALRKSDAIIDFTRPQTSIAYAAYAKQLQIVHIIGTTGFSLSEDKKIMAAARNATIVKSGNMSLGINLLAGFARKAAEVLEPEDFDIEILEMHHRHKVDAPSGTALLLGQAAAEGRKVDLEKQNVRIRDSHTGERKQGTIGFATLRGGTVVGEHSVIFAGEGERILLSHIAEDRSIFARGAIKAAVWAANKPHGLYSMLDVLDLTG